MPKSNSSEPDANILKKSILKLIGGEGGQPMNKSELSRALSLPSKDRPVLRRILREMESTGQLIYGKKGRYATKEQKVTPSFSRRGSDYQERRRSSSPRLTGTLKINPGGHGWFYPSATDELNQEAGIDLTTSPRFYVASRALGTALDGDTVLVKLVSGPVRGRRGDAMEKRARVLSVVERRSGQVTGILHQRGRRFYLHSDDERVPDGILVHGAQKKDAGQVAVVEITDWDDPEQVPEGRVEKILGHPGDPGVAVEEIIYSHGVNQSFPPVVRAAALDVPQEIPPAEVARRADWRKKNVITIDPATAKDYDDAVYVERQGKDYLLAVHIADVSHYVKPGNELDIEAEKRGNSTYLVDRVVPMLPEELSNGICSLHPGVDRLTKCAVITVGPKGALKGAKFYDAIIHTPRKFTYPEAQEVLESEPLTDPAKAQVQLCWELASILRKKRFAKGALDLEMPEVRLNLDEQNKPIGYEKEEYNESHQLIEEFMLLANEAVARRLKRAKRPAVYRVHDSPDIDRLMEYEELARSHGYYPGPLTKREEVQKLLDAAKGEPEEYAIKIGLLKSLKRACYRPTPDGHYGLAKEDYCHFTSPIRRYADLIVHRSLQPLLENPPEKIDRVPKDNALIEIAANISETERTSASAEQESRRMKMLEWLEGLMEQADPPVFSAIITEVRAMGLFIECTDILEKGLVPRSGMPKGFWDFDPDNNRFLSGRGEELVAGQSLELQVSEVNRLSQRVNFKIIGMGPVPERRRSAPAKSAPTKKRHSRGSSRKSSQSTGKSTYRSRSQSGERSSSSKNPKPNNRRKGSSKPKRRPRR